MMQYRDQVLRCAATGKEFVWTVAEQRERARQGLPLDPPLYCPEVRAADSRLADPYDAPRGVPSADEMDEETALDDIDAVGEPGRSGNADRQRSDRRAQGRDPGASRARGDRSPAGGRGGGGTADSHSMRRGPGRRGGPARRRAKQTELRVRHTGTVKWFDEDRGYGFVADDDGGELFLHASCLLVENSSDVMEGTPVEFEVERTDRGPQAVDVILLA